MVVDHESQLGFADDRVSDRPDHKVMLSLSFTPRVLGKKFSPTGNHLCKKVVTDQPEGFLVWHFGHLWILF